MWKSPRRIPFEPLDFRRFELGESARWDGTNLTVVNIQAGDLWRSVGGTEPLEHILHLPIPLGAANPTVDGGSVLSAGDGIAILSSDGSLHWLAHPTQGSSPIRRMNDAAVDPAGRLWSTSMDLIGSPGNGELFRILPGGQVQRAVDGLGCPNGPAFDPFRHRMYLADTGRRIIWSYPLDEEGRLSERSLFTEIPTDHGVPDGMAVDAEDHLWVALWGAARIARFHPDGHLVDLLEVPVRQPTSICLTARHLIVTSASMGLHHPGPLDGAVLIADPPVPGRPAGAFGADGHPARCASEIPAQ